MGNNENNLFDREINSIPVITRFYGITIKMYFNDHLPPHFHAIYGEYNGIFSIDELSMIEDDLPARSIHLVREWGSKYQSELRKMWETKEFIKLPELD